jgi:hypothetical protein
MILLVAVFICTILIDVEMATYNYYFVDFTELARAKDMNDAATQKN